jgi:hypothetical protein
MRDQEERSSKPAQANSSQAPISKNPSQKNKAGEVARGESPACMPQYYQKKKKTQKTRRNKT